MAGSQRKPFTRDEIQQIRTLLTETEMSILGIAEELNCTPTSITRINTEFQIRSHNGRRSYVSADNESIGR